MSVTEDKTVSPYVIPNIYIYLSGKFKGGCCEVDSCFPAKRRIQLDDLTGSTGQLYLVMNTTNLMLCDTAME